jgi:hypothetical protein
MEGTFGENTFAMTFNLAGINPRGSHDLHKLMG